MKKYQRFLSLLLAMAMMLTCVLSTGLVAFATNQITSLYIIDTIDGSSELVDVSKDVADTTWSWDVSAQTLTLTGFNGEYIEADGDLTIVLNGTNTINAPASADTLDTQSCIKISKGDLTIKSNSDSTRDSLAIKGEFTHIVDTNYTLVEVCGNIEIKDVDVDVTFKPASTATSSDIPSNEYTLIAINPDVNEDEKNRGITTVSGDATLDIELEGFANIVGLANFTKQKSTGNINVTINKSSLLTEKTSFCGTEGIFTYASGEIFVSVANEDTDKLHPALNGPLYVEDGAGKITLEGLVIVGEDYSPFSDYYYLADNKEVAPLSTSDATACILVENNNNSYSDYMFTFVDGSNKADPANGIIVKTTTNKSGIADFVVYNPKDCATSAFGQMSELRVGSSFYASLFRGFVFGGEKNAENEYYVSIDPDYPLPAGLSWMKTGSDYMILDAPTEVGSGTVRFIIEDASGQKQYIDIPWTVKERENYLVVNDVSIAITEEVMTGDNWTYDPESNTLTLDNYTGGTIGLYNGNLNIVLKGTNTITMPASTENSDVKNGIFVSTGNLTISSDGDSTKDTLSIGQGAFTHIVNTSYVPISAKGDITITDVDVDITLKPASTITESDLPSSECPAYGVSSSEGSLTLMGATSLDVDIEGFATVIGVKTTLINMATGDISITLNKPTVGSETVSLCGANGFFTSGSGETVITVDKDNSNVDSLAIDGDLYVESTAGEITLNGVVRLGDSISTSYFIDDNKEVSLVNTGDATGVAVIENSYKKSVDFIFTKVGNTSDGVVADGIIIKNTTNSSNIATLKAYNPSNYYYSDFSKMDELKIGKEFEESGLLGYIFGGQKIDDKYTVSVDENYPLPDGLSLEENGNDYKITGTPTTESSGTVRLLISDGASNSTYIDIPWEVNYANPVTGVSLNKSQVDITLDTTETLEATISPVNASVKTVTWSSSDNSVVSVSALGVVSGNKSGKAKVTVTTVQGAMKASCDVYVHENTPNAKIEGSNITGLVAGASYTINGTAIVAGSDGVVELQKDWFGTDLEIIKKSAVEGCDSAAQVIEDLNDKYILDADVTITETDYDYTGEAVKPSIVVEYEGTTLVENTDYTLTCSDNIKCGKNTASVVVTGINDYAGAITRTFSINRVLSSISIVTEPKTTYLEDKETLDLTGGVLKLLYNDSSEETVNMTELVGLTTEGFDNSYVAKDQEVTLSYQGKITTLKVDIIRPDPTSIEVTTNPTQTEYLEKKDTFVSTGGKLSLHYADYTDDIVIDLTDDMVSGFDNTVVGTKTLTVNYAGCETTFDVTIIAKSIVKVEIQSNPTTTTFNEGVERTLDGGKLKVTYDNDEVDVVDFDDADVVVDTIDKTLGAGTQTLNVVYKGVYTNSYVVTINHVWKKATTAATCTTAGSTTYTCTVCGEKKTETIKALGHNYSNGYCTRCNSAQPGTAGANNRLFANGVTATRYYGDTRYKTCLATAEALKTALGVSKFDNIVVVAGFNFPDALSATYLAAKLNAPIIMVNTQNSSTDASGNINYVINNFSKSGKIYLIGGTAAISSSVESTLKTKFSSSKVERIYGQDRYETNAKVLQRTKELGLMSSYDLLVCSGAAFPDALSCSGLGKPIMLVNGGNATSLTSAQKSFVSGASNVYIIGGNAAVNSTLESAIKSTGKLKTRLSGNDRYETSQKIANYFCSSSQSVVLASGLGFADGLCGGSLAYALGAPVVLTCNATINGNANTNYTRAKSVVGSKKVVILGGSASLDNSTAQKIKSASIKEHKYN